MTFNGVSMGREASTAFNLPVRATVIAVVAAVTLGFATGCGGGSKPPAAVAGCDLAPVAAPDQPVMYMIARELYNDHLVTGEPRLSTFDALFSGGRVRDQGALIGWYTIHENDTDLLIDNRTPGEWDTQLTLKVFPQPYTAYHAYCTGWSFKDYASSHWQEVLQGFRPTVTPPSTAPTSATP